MKRREVMLAAVAGAERGDRPPRTVVTAVLTSVTLGLCYWAFGLVTMLVFTAGFVGGLVLWLVWPSGALWSDIRAPYWIALALS